MDCQQRHRRYNNAMQLYGGKIIHRSKDEHGILEVVENAHERSLHFGTRPRQSTMLLHDPIRLSLSYTRAMTCALLFQPDPRRILLIGLGGGSLAKFLLHHFPACHIDAVEYREAVIKLAQGYFRLRDDPRLQLHVDDAARFIRTADEARYSVYDLILVDAFVDDGISRSVCGISFFDHCRARMSENGVMSMNLWSGDYMSPRELLEDLKTAFAGQIVKLPVEGKDNIIGIACRRGIPRQKLKKLDARARDLQQQLEVEYPAFLRQLRKNNSWHALLSA